MGKKLLFMVLVVGFIFGLVGIGLAAPSAYVTVKFAVQNLSVAVSTDQINFGVMSPGGFMVAFSSIAVINDGNGAETFQLSCSTYTVPANFQLTTSTPTTSTEFRALALFNSGQPTISDYDVNNDYLSGNPVMASATKFSGNQQGDSVPASEQRALWLRIDAPTGNPAPGEQNFTVNINAALP